MIRTSIFRNLFNILNQLFPVYKLIPTKFLKRFLKIHLHKSVTINIGVKFYGNGLVTIGRNSWIGNNCSFYTEGSTIKIGNSCDVAPHCKFIVGSHSIGFPRRAGNGYSKPIYIGDGVWIGACSTVLNHVTILESSVVGAGSVVLTDVPSNCLVVGVPAEVVKFYESNLYL